MVRLPIIRFKGEQSLQNTVVFCLLGPFPPLDSTKEAAEDTLKSPLNPNTLKSPFQEVERKALGFFIIKELLGSKGLPDIAFGLSVLTLARPAVISGGTISGSQGREAGRVRGWGEGRAVWGNGYRLKQK